MLKRKKTICPDLGGDFKSVILQEIELARKLKKPNLNYSSRFKELTENEMFYHYISSLLNTSSKFPSDILVLTYYLSHSQGIINMLLEATSDISDLLTHMAIEMKYEHQSSNTLLFRKGDLGDKFYLIIKGKISILIMEEKSVYLSLEEYMIYLIKLRKYREHDLLYNALQKNSCYIHLDNIEFELWLKNLLKNTKVEFNSEISSKVRREFESAQKYLTEDNKSDIMTVEKYIQRIAVERIEVYETVERKKVSVFCYKKILDLIDGDKFGEASIMKDVKFRTASVITLEECHFGILDKKGFNKCLSRLNEKIKKNTLNYFLNNQKLFKGIESRNFSMKFLNFFVLNKCGSKEIIGENEELNHIYFLKSGEYHISFKNSLLYLNDIIINLGGINFNVRDKRKMIEDEDFNKFMNEKRNIKVTILKNNDVLGLDDMIRDNRSLYNVRCISSQGEYYVVEKKLFNCIFENSKLANHNLKEFLEKKKIQMLDRLLALKDSYLHIYRNNNICSEEPIMKHPEINSDRSRKREQNSELPTLSIFKKSDLIKNKKAELRSKLFSIRKDNCFSELSPNINSSPQKLILAQKMRSVSHNYETVILEKDKNPLIKLSTNVTSPEEEIIRNTKMTFKTKDTIDLESKQSIIISKNFIKTNLSFFPKNCCVNPRFNFIDEKKEIVKTEYDLNNTINNIKKNIDEKINDGNSFKDLTISSPKLFNRIKFSSDECKNLNNINSESHVISQKNLLIISKTNPIKEKMTLSKN